MELREATSADFEGVVRLLPSQEELFLVYPRGKHPFTVSQLAGVAETRKELTVAVLEGSVVGFANLYDIEAVSWRSSDTWSWTARCEAKGLAGSW